MTISVSFRDVLTIPEFNKYNEIQLLPVEMDSKVKPYLWQFGMDTKQSFSISAVKHRDLNDKVAIGYRYNGRLRLDKEWTTSKYCDVMQRISATAYYDPSLTVELCNLIGSTTDFNKLDADTDVNEEFPHELISEEYLKDKMLIETLNSVVTHVRGE